MDKMDKSDRTMAQQVAVAASDFQQQSTGVTPKAVTAVLSEDTLVVTLRGALSPAEKALTQRNPAGASQMQEYHRQLFADACQPLRQEIQRIVGVEVREATAEVATTGTIVQVFLLAHGVSAEIWNGQYVQDNGRTRKS
ncbi:MAG: Na-translocating system protein MpsC family protein [Planctomycetota bacterium]|nr:Na-translocating system protein MpsC family protein [Planctomycetota bacterium]